ncbi:MAG: 4Fe-4S dicluster domain-containing protein [Alphaproteobacteria bacterium]|nr:4Fe-4S dicluster domain-containing protein [Alphaproteobacteria bacterium]MCB9791586.1 4Fe-4S dicluster domain-containing protein [Alphaproteobacteria bacterium]
MAELNRRDFFKVVGISSAAGAAGCVEAPFPNPLDVHTPVEALLPYVVQPEQIQPGIPTFFATVCDGCSASCGAVARNREGRVVFVGPNPDSPVGGTGLCSAGVSGVQDTYDPDRYTSASLGGGPVNWTKALETVSKAVTAGKGNGKVAWLGRYRTGATARLISDFMGAVGGRELHWEPLGYESLHKATQLAFGIDGVPRYVIDDVAHIVGFGAEFLGSFLGGVNAGWSKARDPKHGGVVADYTEIAARVSHTGTRCDTWLASKPGTEAGVALALAKLVADKKGGKVAAAAASYLSGVKPDALAGAAGIKLEKLEALAAKLASGPSVVFPGGANNGDTHLALATLVLNFVCGNVGKSVRLTQRNNLGKVSSFAEVEALFKDIAEGKVDTLFIDDLDPAFSLPTSMDVAGILRKVTNLFVFSNRISESTTGNALVLPPGSALERWGDAEAVLGFHGLQQPAMKPIHDTRPMGDVLLEVARAAELEIPAAPAAEEADEQGVIAAIVEKLTEGEEEVEAPAPVLVGGEAAVASFEAKDFYRYVAGHWLDTVKVKDGAQKSFADWWIECLQLGGFFSAVAEAPVQLAANLPKPEAGKATGGTALLLFPHTHLFDGRHSNKAWLQEIPDAVSGYTWTSWAEVSPATAKRLGLTEKDSLSVSSNGVSVEVGVRVSKGMQDDAVALVLGNGAETGNRYAKGWGVNPFRMLKAQQDAVSGALSFAGLTAELARGKNGNPRVSLKGSEDMDGRPVALTTYAPDEVAGKGSGKGSLARGVLVVPEDPRLVERGIHDMFPEPEHPNFRFGLSVDIDACTGCGACEAACMSENNIAIVGPREHDRWRYMNWIRLDRFWEGEGEHPDVRYLPAICQQCSHAPCEGVCPVVATYHNVDGLNAMIYNRCVGTRYCANNCPYSSRRFNFHTYRWPEAYELMLNPDVVTREMGVMEKCTFCVQRIRYAKIAGREGAGSQPEVSDALWQHLPACAEVCPSNALTFGNVKEESAEVTKRFNDPRAYTLFGELNTKPGVRYLAKRSFLEEASHHGGGGHGEEHGGGHGEEQGGGHAAKADHGKPDEHGKPEHGKPEHGKADKNHETQGHGDAAGGNH